MGKGVEEIVVARSSTGPAKAIAYVSIVIVVVRAWAIIWPVRVVFLAVVFWIIYVLLQRLTGMKLSVSHESVHVVNFNSKFELDINSVRIDDEKNPHAWPKDDFIKVKPDPPKDPEEAAEENAKKARTLVLTDDTGIKAPVGVAPSYGTRLDEIAEGLYIAIDRMRLQP